MHVCISRSVIHTNTLTYMYIYVWHTNIYIHICTNIYIHICIYFPRSVINTNKHISMYIYVWHTTIYIHICIFFSRSVINTNTLIYIYIYVYIHVCWCVRTRLVCVCHATHMHESWVMSQISTSLIPHIPRAANQRFVIFGAWDKITPCFGGLSRERRTCALKGADPSEILRAQVCRVLQSTIVCVGCEHL